MAKLLLIDDDKEVLTINMKYFRNEGYEVKATTGATVGLRLIEEFQPDCIILDIMMPKMDGFSACSEIKKITNAPIIFLTGKTEEDDKIKGLLLGADDYMIKPYSLRELSARVQVLIRRCSASASAPVLNRLDFPPLSLDIARRKAYYNEEEIQLSNREYELLYYLASKPNEIVSFQELTEIMFGSYSDSDRRTVMVTASRLRKKMELYTGLADLIETAWGKGYQFVPK